MRQLRSGGRSDDGFTLVELLVALLVLTIVLAAMGPALVSLLTATGSTNQRSVANGLAVQAIEQIRAVPYNEIGYPSGSLPSNCPGAVSLSSTSTPIVPSTTATVANVHYTINNCVTWVGSSSNTTQTAYKQSVVTVSWTADGLSSSVSQTSAIYPGGLGSYQAENNGSSGSPVTTVVSGPPPAPPLDVTAADDPSAPTNTITVTWQQTTWSTPNGGYYVVGYTTDNYPAPGYNYATDASGQGGPSVTWDGNYTLSPETTGTCSPTTGVCSDSITVAPGTTYYFQVQATDTGDQQTSVITSNTATATTQTVASPTCSINTLTVNPSQGKNSNKGVPVTSSGQLYNSPYYFSLSVNANSACTNVTVGYAPTACTPGASGCPTTYATMTGSGGTLYGTTQSNLAWNDGTQIFTVFTGASNVQYSPLVQAQVQICTVNNGGQC